MKLVNFTEKKKNYKLPYFTSLIKNSIVIKFQQKDIELSK